MKTFKHIGLLGALVATALMGACTNKDDYTPGPEVASGCQQVHFTNTNNPICVLNLDNANERTATLILKRNNAGAELNMPVKVVSQSAGLEIPTSVTFAAGDSLAELNIKAPQQVKLKDVYKYEVKLEGKRLTPILNSMAELFSLDNSTSPKQRRPIFGWLTALMASRYLTIGKKR